MAILSKNGEKMRKGYTLIEVLIVVVWLVTMTVLGIGIYVGLHFIGKYW